jgi:hypothetical protein
MIKAGIDESKYQRKDHIGMNAGVGNGNKVNDEFFLWDDDNDDEDRGVVESVTECTVSR